MSATEPLPNLNPVLERLAAVRREVEKVFIGDRRLIDALLIALLARGHVLLEGVPGIAKTTLVKAFATAMGCPVRRIQFTPDLLPSDITGAYVYNPRDASFELRRGPIFTHVVLADEINRAPAKTQSALLEAMQEQHVTIDGESLALPEPFLVLATENPIDLEGTYTLPEAQIDRFLLRLRLGYPTLNDEIRMLESHGVAAPEPHPVLSPTEVLTLQAYAQAVFVERDLLEYAARLASFTRAHPKVVLGASPRASLSLLRAGRAHALLSARSYLVPDDLRAVADAVLAHRLMLTAEAEGDPNAASSLIREALERVPYRKPAHGAAP